MPFHYHYYAVRYQETDPESSENLVPFVTELVRTMNLADPLMRVYFRNSNDYKQRKDFYNLKILKDYDYAALKSLPAERILNDFEKNYENKVSDEINNVTPKETDAKPESANE